MIPTGGLSTLIHILINITAPIVRRVRSAKLVPTRIGMPRIPAAIVGVGACAVIMFNAGILLVNALQNENNLDHIAFLTTECSPFPITPGNRRVVIRVDDIQAFAWADISRRLINDALSRGIPLTLAVIPIGLRHDIGMYNYLRSVRCNVEFALHGWDNREPEPGIGEFALLSEDEAHERLTKGISTIERLARSIVTTFVPPLNAVSEGSRKAIVSLEIPIISSEGEGPYDFDATMFDFVQDVFVGTGPILTRCEEEFLEPDGLCVIMIHPQDFATDGAFDQTKFAEFIKMLEGLSSEGATFLRFSDLKSHS